MSRRKIEWLLAFKGVFIRRLANLQKYQIKATEDLRTNHRLSVLSSCKSILQIIALNKTKVKSSLLNFHLIYIP